MTAPPKKAYSTEWDPNQQPVDGVDEADHDAMQTAIAAALVILLLAWLAPGPPSIFGRSKEGWKAQLRESVGRIVEGFMQRSASDLAATAEATGASVAAAEAVAEEFPKVMGAIERWTQTTLDHLERDRGRDAVAAEVQTAAENIARAAAAYAKSEARDTTAGKLGAVWSEWKSRGDKKVRDTHQHLDGSKVPYGGRFVSVSGALLRFPGDPQAPLEETMGCRCRLRYRLRPAEQDDYAEV